MMPIPGFDVPPVGDGGIPPGVRFGVRTVPMIPRGARPWAMERDLGVNHAGPNFEGGFRVGGRGQRIPRRRPVNIGVAMPRKFAAIHLRLGFVFRTILIFCFHRET